MGLISRVSSRTYRSTTEKSKMSDQDVENTITKGVGDLTLEKKKKKKKPKTEGETNGLDLDLTKKKKKKKKTEERDVTPDGNDDDAGDAPKLNLGAKKPKKVKA